MSVVITKETFIPTMGEVNGKEFGVFTETAGYRSSKKLIEGFLQAGEAIKAAASAGAYDSDDFNPSEDPSLSVRDMELSEVGAEISRLSDVLESTVSSASEVVKGVEGETAASVSPDSASASFDE